MWVRGRRCPPLAFTLAKPSTLRASTPQSQSLGSGLVSFLVNHVLAKLGSQEQEAPLMELLLLLPEIKQVRDQGHRFRVRESPSLL